MMTRALVALALGVSVADAQPPAPAPVAQVPSPMVDATRAHGRIAPDAAPAGTRRTFAGPQGKPVQLYVPTRATHADRLHLVIHFLGAAYVPETAVAAFGHDAIALTVSIGAGSGVYDRAFSEPAAFDSLVAGAEREASVALGRTAHVRRITLAGFSAGYGAVRAILRDSAHVARVSAVLLMDGMHTSYVPDGTRLADGGTLDERNLAPFARFAERAAHGEKRMLVTHSEIFPGTYASTTETADWLLKSLGLARAPVLRWGPHGMQQLSEARRGRFTLMGFAGNSAPDHIDQLHGEPEFLRSLWR